MDEIKQQIVTLIPKLRRYARALTRDNEGADDLVQDTLVRALDKLELWESGSDIRAWLFTILHNVYINNLKKHGQLGINLPLEEVTEGLSYADASSELLELADCVKALDLLSLEQREIVLLIALEGMKYSEVAEIVGIPVGTVMSRLSRARQTIRDIVDGKHTIK